MTLPAAYLFLRSRSPFGIGVPGTSTAKEGGRRGEKQRWQCRNKAGRAASGSARRQGNRSAGGRAGEERGRGKGAADVRGRGRGRKEAEGPVRAVPRRAAPLVGVVIGVLISRVTWPSREREPTCAGVLRLDSRSRRGPAAQARAPAGGRRAIRSKGVVHPSPCSQHPECGKAGIEPRISGVAGVCGSCTRRPVQPGERGGEEFVQTASPDSARRGALGC